MFTGGFAAPRGSDGKNEREKKREKRERTRRRGPTTS